MAIYHNYQEQMRALEKLPGDRQVAFQLPNDCKVHGDHGAYTINEMAAMRTGQPSLHLWEDRGVTSPASQSQEVLVSHGLRLCHNGTMT